MAARSQVIGALHRLQLLPIPTQVVPIQPVRPQVVVRDTAATTHVINHNLGYYPTVSLYTLDGRTMLANCVVTDTTITVTSLIPTPCIIVYY